MPEGDTLYRIAAALREAFVEARIVRAETREPAWHAALDARPLAGRVFAAIEARGKHLLLVCRDPATTGTAWEPAQRLALDLREDDYIVHAHLGMLGAWWIDPPGDTRGLAPRTVHLDTDRGRARCRTPQVFRVLTPRDLLRSDVAALGPDLTRDAPDLAAATAALAALGDLTIGEALLRQRSVAGIGNVVKSEALFLSRVSPWARVASLDAPTLATILEHAARILHDNRTRSGRRRTVHGGAAAPSLWVYGRTGEPCLRCVTPVCSELQGADARRTYFCPRCQAAPEPPR